MPGVIPDEGEFLMLRTVLGLIASEAIELRLYINDKVPGLTDTVAAYTEMTGHGYAAQPLVTGDWTVTAADAGTNTPALGLVPVQTFLFTGAGVPTDVYGSLLVGAVSGMLWGAQRFDDGPYRVANAGDQIDVTPTLRLRSGYP